MLKNRDERIKYIENNENWIEIGNIENVVRLSRLKGTMVCKIECKVYIVYDHKYIWSKLDYYRVIGEEKKYFKMSSDSILAKNELINYIKILKEWKVKDE